MWNSEDGGSASLRYQVIDEDVSQEAYDLPLFPIDERLFAQVNPVQGTSGCVIYSSLELATPPSICLSTYKVILKDPTGPTFVRYEGRCTGKDCATFSTVSNELTCTYADGTITCGTDTYQLAEDVVANLEKPDYYSKADVEGDGSINDKYVKDKNGAYIIAAATQQLQQTSTGCLAKDQTDGQLWTIDLSLVMPVFDENGIATTEPNFGTYYTDSNGRPQHYTTQARVYCKAGSASTAQAVAGARVVDSQGREASMNSLATGTQYTLEGGVPPGGSVDWNIQAITGDPVEKVSESGGSITFKTQGVGASRIVGKVLGKEYTTIIGVQACNAPNEKNTLSCACYDNTAGEVCNADTYCYANSQGVMACSSNPGCTDKTRAACDCNSDGELTSTPTGAVSIGDVADDCDGSVFTACESTTDGKQCRATKQRDAESDPSDGDGSGSVDDEEAGAAGGEGTACKGPNGEEGVCRISVSPTGDSVCPEPGRLLLSSNPQFTCENGLICCM